MGEEKKGHSGFGWFGENLSSRNKRKQEKMSSLSHWDLHPSETDFVLELFVPCHYSCCKEVCGSPWGWRWAIHQASPASTFRRLFVLCQRQVLWTPFWDSAGFWSLTRVRNTHDLNMLLSHPISILFLFNPKSWPASKYCGLRNQQWYEMHKTHGTNSI